MNTKRLIPLLMLAAWAAAISAAADTTAGTAPPTAVVASTFGHTAYQKGSSDCFDLGSGCQQCTMLRVIRPRRHLLDAAAVSTAEGNKGSRHENSTGQDDARIMSQLYDGVMQPHSRFSRGGTIPRHSPPSSSGGSWGRRSSGGSSGSGSDPGFGFNPGSVPDIDGSSSSSSSSRSSSSEAVNSNSWAGTSPAKPPTPGAGWGSSPWATGENQLDDYWQFDDPAGYYNPSVGGGSGGYDQYDDSTDSNGYDSYGSSSGGGSSSNGGGGQYYNGNQPNQLYDGSAGDANGQQYQQKMRTCTGCDMAGFYQLRMLPDGTNRCGEMFCCTG